jgi:hypothetical protein
MLVSEEAPVGLTVAEKLCGLISIFLGGAIAYFTIVDPPKTGGHVESYSFAFLIGGFILIVLGVFLLLVKAE